MSFLKNELLNRTLVGIIYTTLFLIASQSIYFFFLHTLLSFFLIVGLFEFYKITKKSKNIFIKLFLPVLWILIPLICLFLIKFQFENGKSLLTFLIILVWINDVSAFLVGKSIGSLKLSHISPKKTIEGVIGSFVFCLLLGPCLITFFKIDLNFNQFLLCFLISMASNFGDLLESLIKRKFDQKDSGQILMSHGGILDRIDSLLISGPLFYFILTQYLN